MTTTSDALGLSLRAAWLDLLRPFGAPEAAVAAAFAKLADRYSEQGRHYHNLVHLAEMLAVIDRLAATANNPTAVRLAAWFHDADYDSRAKDNEDRSAELAQHELVPLGLPEPLVVEVKRLILLTKAHAAESDDRDGHVLLDADLAILAADEARYDEYARAVRREYAWVPDDNYRTGRARVLDGFLKRPRIYFTDAMFRSREAAARHNLRRELDWLRQPPGEGKG